MTDNNQKKFSQLEELLSKLHDGLASEEEKRTIEETLSGDPDACEFYLDYTELCAQMEFELGARTPLDIGEQAISNQISESTALFYKGQTTKQILTPSWRPKPALAAAAIFLLFIGTISLIINKRFSITPQTLEAQNIPAKVENITHEGVAILMESVGASFVNNGTKPSRENGILYPGEILLESGIAAIEFYSGARVILEGPAIFELTSENSAILREGRMRALVPPQACGFSVSTRQIEVIDLGTEFGMNIEEDGHLTEVHCFEGLVDIYESNFNKTKDNKVLRSLESGEAINIQASEIQKMSANPMAFISYNELAQTFLENSSHRHEKWKSVIEEIRANQDILALYTFEDQGPRERSLVNQVSFQNHFSHGAIVGCRWTNGRWPSKGALEFKSPSDRVHLQSVDPHQTITLSTWVRFDTLPKRTMSLLSSTENSSNSMNWFIQGNGSLVFSVRSDNGKQNHKFASPSIIDRSMLGKWQNLLTVFNPIDKSVAHYLNAQQVSTTKISKKGFSQVLFGNAEIGNSSLKNSNGKTPVRFFMGRIDELSIFGRALDQDSINKIYQIGKPN